MKQQEFKKWLVTFDGKKESTADNYSRAIDNISEHYSSEKNEQINVYDIVDLDSLTEIREKYGFNGEFFDFGDKSNGTNRAAINCFYRFIKEKHTKSLSNIDKIWCKIDDFRYTKKEFPNTKSLQEGLLLYLQENSKDFHWQKEYRPLKKYKDKIDLFGVDENGFKIVIELDTNRADQVAKKFVSRMALLREDDVLYIVLCYPPKDSEVLNKEGAKNEVKKYLNFCKTLVEYFNENKRTKKYFKSKFLK